MGKLKGTKTELNLMAAFAGESQARNRYTLAAGVARKEGYVKIANILEETANQEKEHAKRLFKFLEGGEVTITGSFPAGIPGPLADHLASAAAGEHHEWTSMYPEFAKIADAEGFPAIAEVMRSIAVAEKYHEERFNHYLAEIKDGTFFKKNKPVKWRCQNCGYIHEGPEAPGACMACAHPRDHFEAMCC